MMDEAGSQAAFATKPLPELPMLDEIPHPVPPKPRWKRRVTLAALAIAVIAAAVVLPPLINISSYQRQITALMSRSLGRPVHLSGVELRLLPRPGFVLHDLSVSEDPKFGAEPILSARTVVASIRISSLWQGRLMVNRISVDEASLNLVRLAQGQWNLQSVMTGGLMDDKQIASNPAASKSSVFTHKPAPFPYLEATNSRVNLKNGVEKSPFSIVNTELSLSQDNPGNWRLRLRGQPARTDMEISSGDTGEVRVEASLNNSVPAKNLRDMPLKLQMEWRDVQLGQLSRLLLGSDAGWRGDLAADMEVQGTPDAAQIKARLRATGVRRQEFAPETPLDFDANCSFLYQHSQYAVRDLGCDTAIGNGLLHLKANLPGDSGNPEAMLEVKQIPLQAGLDLLRTVRSGFAPGMAARGTANGSLSLVTIPPAAKKTGVHGAAAKRVPKTGKTTGKSESGNQPSGGLNLQGTLTIDGGELRGGALKQPVRLPRMTLIPGQFSTTNNGSSFKTGLSSRFTVSLGPSTEPPAPVNGTDSSQTTPGKTRVSQAVSRSHEITVRLGLTADGYDTVIGGSASPTQLRDLAYAFGAPHLDVADNLAAGSSADLDFTAAGPWIISGDVPSPQPATSSVPQRVVASSSGSVARTVPASVSSPAPNSVPSSDHLAGSLQLHHAQWKAPYLARSVELPLGTIAIIDGALSMTSSFNYGTLSGSMVVNAPLACSTAPCLPEIHLRLGAVDAGAVQTTLLGIPEKKGLLSPLMDRMRASEKPKWPTVILDVQADSLVLGPTTLLNPAIRMRTDGSDLVLENWEAALLGGTAKGQGRFSWASDGTSDGLKYALEGDFTKLSATFLGTILQGGTEEDTSAGWSGGPLSGHGSVELSGLTDKQLAASASGTAHFSWPHGSLPIRSATSARTAATLESAGSPAEVHFDDWSGTVTIHNGQAQLGENAMRQGRHITSITGAIPFGSPAKLVAAPPNGKGAPSHPAAAPKVQ
jgi:hypothetical protein